jgi:hypothetical protein
MLLITIAAPWFAVYRDHTGKPWVFLAIFALSLAIGTLRVTTRIRARDPVPRFSVVLLILAWIVLSVVSGLVLIAR